MIIEDAVALLYLAQVLSGKVVIDAVPQSRAIPLQVRVAVVVRLLLEQPVRHLRPSQRCRRQSFSDCGHESANSRPRALRTRLVPPLEFSGRRNDGRLMAGAGGLVSPRFAPRWPTSPPL